MLGRQRRAAGRRVPPKVTRDEGVPVRVRESPARSQAMRTTTASGGWPWSSAGTSGDVPSCLARAAPPPGPHWSCADQLGHAARSKSMSNSCRPLGHRRSMSRTSAAIHACRATASPGQDPGLTSAWWRRCSARRSWCRVRPPGSIPQLRDPRRPLNRRCGRLRAPWRRGAHATALPAASSRCARASARCRARSAAPRRSRGRSRPSRRAPRLPALAS